MIHIRKSKDGQFYVIVKSRNGEILSQSETLKRKENAWKNIRAQAKAFRNELSFKVKDDTTGKAYWMNSFGDKVLCK